MATATKQFQFTAGSVKKATVGISSGDLWKVPFNSLRVIPGFNAREKDADYKASVREYADSMKANGYDQTNPMKGYVIEEDGEHFIGITDGHTRYDAIMLARKEGAEIETVPVVTAPRGTSMEDITIALVTANTGKPLKPYAVATVCKRLVGYGMEVKDIATRLGLTKPYVDALLDLLASPKALREMVSSGQVSATLAMETVKKHGKEASKVLSKGVVAAKAAGKDRVTAKHIKPATALPKAKKAAPVEQLAENVAQTSVPATIEKAVPPNDTENLLVLGAQWIIENSGDTTHRNMLAFIAGVSRKDVDAAIEEDDSL